MLMEDDRTNTHLDTIIIYTTKIKALAEFYRLGLQLQAPLPHGENHLGFQLLDVYLGLDKIKEDQTIHTGAISLWFRVDNLKEKFERFKDLGAKVKYPPTKKPWGDVLSAVFDPDGNIIGLA